VPPPAATQVDRITADMVNALLMAEQSNGWNAVSPEVQAWQKSRGLVTDGKFGPKSALAVAQEFGTVPIIRFWPKGSQKAPALQAYRSSLVEIANSSPDATRAAQLRVTAQREQAQSFGVKEGKAPALPQSLRVSLAKVA
jgi:peptidoglycan hydrolase-like protein with peptidoglycan-binding domain